MMALAIVAMTGLHAQDCSELFISEYLEGSGNNIEVEIYNPTPDVIILTSYYVAR